MNDRKFTLSGSVRTQFHDEFGPAVAYVGPNSTYKSTRHTALDLIFNGKRIEGGRIEDLFPKNLDHASAELSFDEQRYSYDSRTATGSNASIPLMIIRPASWLASLGKAGAIEEVLRQWGGDEAALMLSAPGSLTEAQQLLWQTTISSIRSALEKQKKSRKSVEPDDASDDPASILASINPVMRSLKLTKSAEISTLKDVIQTNVEGQSVEENIAALDREIVLAERWERAESDRRQLAQIRQDSDTYARSLETYYTLPALPDIAAAEAEENAARDAYQRHSETLWLIAKIYERIEAKDPLIAALHISDLFAASHSLTEAWHKETESSKAAESRLNDAFTKIVAWRQAYTERQAVADKLTAECDRINRMTAEVAPRLAGLPETIAHTSQSLRTRRDTAIAAKERRSERTKAAERVAKLEDEYRNVKAVEEAASIQYAKVTTSILDRMHAAIDTFMSPSFRGRFAFDIKHGRFTMRGDDGESRAWRDQGDGEFAALTLAYARAIAAKSGKHGILLLSERDLAPISAIGTDGEQSALASTLETLAIEAHRGPYLLLVVVVSPTPLPLSTLWTTIETRKLSRHERPQLTVVPSTPTFPASPALSIAPPAPPASYPIAPPTFVVDQIIPGTIAKFDPPLPSTIAAPTFYVKIGEPSPPQPTTSAEVFIPSAETTSVDFETAQLTEVYRAELVTAEQIIAHAWPPDHPNVPREVVEWCQRHSALGCQVAVAQHPDAGWVGARWSDYVAAIVEAIAVTSSTTAPAPATRAAIDATAAADTMSPDDVANAAERTVKRRSPKSGGRPRKSK